MKKQNGLDGKQGKKDGNSYNSSKDQISHSIQTFYSDISNLADGKYKLVDGAWVKQE